MQGDEKAAKDISMAQRKRGLATNVEEAYRKVTKFIDTPDAIRAEKPHWMKPMMQMWNLQMVELIVCISLMLLLRTVLQTE